MVDDVTVKTELIPCDGGVLEYAFNFHALSKEELSVLYYDGDGNHTTLTYGADYTVVPTHASLESGGEVILAFTPTDGYSIQIVRNTTVLQPYDPVSGGGISAASVEKALDRAIMILQENADKVSRSLVMPPSETEELELPSRTELALHFLAFDADGEPIPADPTNVPVSDFMQTVLDDADAGAALTTLGISSFIQTLLDDADAGTARDTLEIRQTIAALPDHYERDQRWASKGDSTAADRYALLSPEYMTVNINDSGYVLTAQEELDLSAEASWDDTGTTDWTVAANRAGKDFYVYACVPSSGYSPDIILSNNSTIPTGYTANNSRKIGGFHCLCEDVGTISGHDLTDYVAGDILPASVWDLNHRPVASPEGMVYDEGGDVWWDIYLASWDSGLESVNGGTIADGESTPALHWYNFAEEFAEVKKRLPTQQEFLFAALGSPQETNISGSADPGTTGGHSDTASRRIISNIGCEDMTGVLIQWGADGGATNDVGSAWAVADTAGTAGSLDNSESIGRGQHFEAPNRPRFGGFWSEGVRCGSRGSHWNISPLDLNVYSGARGVAEPRNKK